MIFSICTKIIVQSYSYKIQQFTMKTSNKKRTFFKNAPETIFYPCNIPEIE